MDTAEFEQRYLAACNPQQRRAVETVNGPVLLLAVPGSGKTTVLLTRLGYMTLCRGIPGERILTMTYTTAATREMAARCRSMFGPECAARLRFCTINSLSNYILKTYAACRGKQVPFTLLENDEANRLTEEILLEVQGEYPAEGTVREVRNAFTYIKNKMLTEEEIQALDLGISKLPGLYARYCAALKENARMDFDDQMAYALDILRGSPAMLRSMQEQFPWLCVDEAQDTSRIQHEIIRLLARKSGNLFLVGDEDQSIYGFRAACPEALLSFREDYPGAEILLMERNYRSTPEITAAAGAFVAKNRFRYEKQLIPTRESGAAVEIVRADSRMSQFRFAAALAESCREETAVLFRNNDSAIAVIDLLDRRGIPYICRQFEDTFFTHRIVADLTDLIRFALDPRDGEAFTRISSRLPCAISRDAALWAREKAEAFGTSIPEQLPLYPEFGPRQQKDVEDFCETLPQICGKSGEEAVMFLWRVLQYGTYAARHRLDTGKFEILCMLARNEPGPRQLLDRLDRLREIVLTHRNPPDCRFTLSTIHSSKGLEYKNVYLMDVFDGILPGKNRSQLRTGADIDAYEEDRRVFYVAMTRAKDRLHLIFCRDRASSFLSEVRTALPGSYSEESDLFHSLDGDLCGKTCRIRGYGSGTVLVHSEMALLVEFQSGHTGLFSLEELWHSRDRTPVRKSPSTALSQAAPDFVPGTRVTHAFYGPGVIRSEAAGMVTVRFDSSGAEKTFHLETCIRQGLLK